jgi:hypothetical protein
MALGLFGKAKTADSNSSTDEKYHSKDHGYDPETIGAGTNRIADPGAVRDPEMGVDSDSEASIIGKQVAMEAENAIKYRTCSWQKARYVGIDLFVHR